VSDRIDPVLDLSPRFRALATDSRLTGVVASLIGGDARVFKAKLISKWPGTLGYGLHQDFPYWPGVERVPPDHLINLVVAIDPFTDENGGIEVFPGLHRSIIPSLDPGTRDLSIEQTGGILPRLLSLQSGGLAVFHALAPHRSDANRSESSRESLLLTYTRAEHGDVGRSYYRRRPAGWIDP
jgi:ectoine hydroxylase-related dioxygenase (phytanoyl-CoA dioxygenase family)